VQGLLTDFQCKIHPAGPTRKSTGSANFYSNFKVLCIKPILAKLLPGQALELVIEPVIGKATEVLA
jgi:hypothetical protein